MWLWIVGVLLWGYAIGCLHGSVIAQKISGVNLKETGVKNAGASNATIVLGKKFGALVAAIDIGKGAVSCLTCALFRRKRGTSRRYFSFTFIPRRCCNRDWPQLPVLYEFQRR